MKTLDEAERCQANSAESVAVVIVGGGVMGFVAALRLLEDGITDFAPVRVPPFVSEPRS